MTYKNITIIRRRASHFNDSGFRGDPRRLLELFPNEMPLCGSFGSRWIGFRIR